jgi:hypothetical protein
MKDHNYLKELFKKLELMEVEGRYFMLHKSTQPITDRPRTDKAYGFHLSHVEAPAFALIKRMGR